MLARRNEPTKAVSDGKQLSWDLRPGEDTLGQFSGRPFDGGAKTGLMGHKGAA